MKPRTFLEKYALLILAGFAFAAPLLVTFAGKTVQNNNNKVEDWLPKTFTETGELAWFREHFFGDQFIILSWDGCRLGGEPGVEGAAADDPRIEQVARLLVSDAEVREIPLNKYFKKVTTGRRVLDQLTAPPMNVPYDEAVQRLVGSLIGPDGHQTCLVISMTNDAAGKFRDAIGRGDTRLMKSRQVSGILFDALKACNVDPQLAYLGGPPADNVAIDEEGERTLIRLAGLSGLLGIGLAWYSLKSIKLTTIVLACGLLSAATALALVSLMGYTSDAVMLSMPSLVYVLAISGAVHLINYYREAIEKHGLRHAAETAIAHGWKPAVLCNVTTSIGLISLYASDLVPIRKFGLFSALGVMGSLIVLLCFLPAALHLWPEKKLLEHKPKRKGETRWARFVRRFEETADSFWDRFGGAIIRHHGAVLFACLGFIALVGWGVTRVETSIDLMKLFDSKARVIHDYEWLEANVGRLVPMELVLNFDAEAQRSANGDQPDDVFRLSLLERMETVAAVQEALDRRFGKPGDDVIGPSLSAVTFAPPLPTERGDTMNFLRRSTLNRKLEENHDKLLGTDYLRVEKESGNELWRISLRVAAFQDVDYGAFTDDVREVVEPLLIAQRERFQILRAVTAAREGNSYAGGTVCIWEGDTNSATETAQHSLVETLRQQLMASRVRVAYVRAAEGSERTPPTEKLARFNVVALAGHFSTEKVKELEAAGTRVVKLGPPLQSLAGGAVKPATVALQKAAAALVTPDPNVQTLQPVTAVYTGVVPIVYKAQRALLTSLIDSSLWSFTTITPLLMLVSRGILAGCVTMIPNVLPVLVVFGGMGWLGLPVDIGSMMAASIALGVAVDDTIHYLTWFREDLEISGDRKHAIMAAYHRCATPTLQSALINGLGLSVFAFSTFTPTRQFGYLMLTILIAGVVAELVMMPALLAGPCGRVFRVRRRKHEDANGDQPGDDRADETPADVAEPRDLEKEPAEERVATAAATASNGSESAIPAPHGKLLERKSAGTRAAL